MRRASRGPRALSLRTQRSILTTFGCASSCMTSSSLFCAAPRRVEREREGKTAAGLRSWHFNHSLPAPSLPSLALSLVCVLRVASHLEALILKDLLDGHLLARVLGHGDVHRAKRALARNLLRRVLFAGAVPLRRRRVLCTHQKKKKERRERESQRKVRNEIFPLGESDHPLTSEPEPDDEGLLVGSPARNAETRGEKKRVRADGNRKPKRARARARMQQPRNAERASAPSST